MPHMQSHSAHHQAFAVSHITLQPFQILVWPLFPRRFKFYHVDDVRSQAVHSLLSRIMLTSCRLISKFMHRNGNKQPHLSGIFHTTFAVPMGTSTINSALQIVIYWLYQEAVWLSDLLLQSQVYVHFHLAEWGPERSMADPFTSSFITVLELTS